MQATVNSIHAIHPKSCDAVSPSTISRAAGSFFGQYLPDADLLLIATKTRRERVSGNVTCRKAVTPETARRSSISPDH